MGKCNCGKVRLHEDPKGNSLGEPVDGVFHSDRVNCHYLIQDYNTGPSAQDTIISDFNNKKAASSEGIKHDSDKPDLTLIPTEAIYQMGQAFTYGSKKYKRHNYRLGMNSSRQLAAALRHIYQHLDGEDLDPESGHSHLGHALASIAMAVYTLANHPQLDDRHDQDKLKHTKVPKDFNNKE